MPGTNGQVIPMMDDWSTTVVEAQKAMMVHVAIQDSHIQAGHLLPLPCPACRHKVQPVIQSTVDHKCVVAEHPCPSVAKKHSTWAVDL